MKRYSLSFCLVLACSLFVDVDGRAQKGAVDWLPDLGLSTDRLGNWTLDDDLAAAPGRVVLRLDSEITNTGLGRFRLDADSGDGQSPQPVVQLIDRSDGGVREIPVPNFSFLPGPRHMLADSGWSEYRLRHILPNDGVGDEVAYGQKVDFCAVDSLVFDNTVENFNLFPRQDSCTPPQGITPGFLDLYTKSFPFQWVDITDVPRGNYWLEVTVDGAGNIMESDETNNTSRIKILLDDPLMPLGYPTDLDGENGTNAADLQNMVNAIVTNAFSTTVDVNGNGALDAADVQLVVNAILEG